MIVSHSKGVLREIKSKEKNLITFIFLSKDNIIKGLYCVLTNA